MARDGERGHRRRGARHNDPYAEGAGGADSAPVDISAVRRDDALIDAIVSDGPVQTESEAEFALAGLLADWRAEMVAAPLSPAPDLDTVVAAVNQEIGAANARTRARAKGRLRLVRPIAGAAAAIAVVMGGLTVFAYNADPEDPLWRVKEVVFSEQAESTMVHRTDDDLLAAQKLLASGDPEQAQQRLAHASSSANRIKDSGQRDDLMNRWRQLMTELRKLSPEAANQLEGKVPPSVQEPQPDPSDAVSTAPTSPEQDQSTVAPAPGTGVDPETDPTAPTEPDTPSTDPDTTTDAPNGTTDPGTTGPTAPTTTMPTIMNTEVPVPPTSVPVPPITAPESSVAPTTIASPVPSTGSPSTSG